VDGSAASIERLTGEVLPAAHRRLEALLAPVAREGSAEPTRLEGWTRGHLVAHLRLNAEGQHRLLSGARRGEMVEQYVGGAAGRAAHIEAQSGRPLAGLVADLGRSQRRLEELWSSLTEADWQRPTKARAGVRPAHFSLWARWREVELHAVDLDIGRSADGWTTEFATAGLEVNLDGTELRALAERLDDQVVVELTDGSSASTWCTDRSAAATHRGMGPVQALLAWVVGRPAQAAVAWEPAAPLLDPWP
jgi:maleylpyruvate isomerase